MALAQDGGGRFGRTGAAAQKEDAQAALGRARAEALEEIGTVDAPVQALPEQPRRPEQRNAVRDDEERPLVDGAQQRVRLQQHDVVRVGRDDVPWRPRSGAGNDRIEGALEVEPVDGDAGDSGARVARRRTARVSGEVDTPKPTGPSAVSRWTRADNGLFARGRPCPNPIFGLVSGSRSSVD